MHKVFSITHVTVVFKINMTRNHWPRYTVENLIFSETDKPFGDGGVYTGSMHKQFSDSTDFPEERSYDIGVRDREIGLPFYVNSDRTQEQTQKIVLKQRIRTRQKWTWKTIQNEKRYFPLRLFLLYNLCTILQKGSVVNFRPPKLKLTEGEGRIYRYFARVWIQIVCHWDQTEGRK